MKQIPRLLLLLCLAVGGLRAANAPVEMAQRFREELKSVDRLVLMRAEWDELKDKDAGKIVLEIKGTAAIASLGDTLEIKRFDMECLCVESPEMRFYQGENYRFSMTLHHSHRLRGEDLVWGGDAVLTEQSAEKFRAWFAQRGFDGFVKGNAAMLKGMVEDKAQREKFLEIFPEQVRRNFPNDDEKYNREAKLQKQHSISAYYQDRTALILDCWRGLGLFSPSYNSGDWRREYQESLRDLLNASEVSSLKQALEALPLDEDRVWVGAYRYYQRHVPREEDEMFIAYSEEWLARLARRVMPLEKYYAQKSIIYDLAKRPAVATNWLLLEIAESGSLDMPKTESSGGWTPPLELPMAANALLELAKNRVSECRPILARRLTEVTEGEVRLALEVALAQFTGPGAIKPVHLQSKVREVADLAWQTGSKDPNAQVSIETLAGLATDSSSYQVRKAAAEKFATFGLRVMSDDEKAKAILGQPRFKEAESLSAIEALINEIKENVKNRNSDAVEQRILAALNHRMGSLALNNGNYEKAALLLSVGRADRQSGADRTFALQTLGRFDDAATDTSRSTEHENEEAESKYLERCGYLAFAQKQYDFAAANFDAAITVFPVAKGRLTIMWRLCLLLKADKSGSDQIGLKDEGFYSEDLKSGTERSPAEWPNSGIDFLNGQLSEADLLGSIRLDRKDSNGDLCEVHFLLSVSSRMKGDVVGEMKHLQAALETKAFTNQCYSLATIRVRELSLVKK